MPSISNEPSLLVASSIPEATWEARRSAHIWGNLSWESGREIEEKPTCKLTLVAPDSGAKNRPDILMNAAAIPVWSTRLLAALDPDESLTQRFRVYNGSSMLRNYRAVNVLHLVAEAVDWEASDVGVRTGRRDRRYVEGIRRLALRPESIADVNIFRIRECRMLVFLAPDAVSRFQESQFLGVKVVPLSDYRRGSID